MTGVQTCALPISLIVQFKDSTGSEFKFYALSVYTILHCLSLRIIVDMTFKYLLLKSINLAYAEFDKVIFSWFRMSKQCLTLQLRLFSNLNLQGGKKWQGRKGIEGLVAHLCKCLGPILWNMLIIIIDLCKAFWWMRLMIRFCVI